MQDKKDSTTIENKINEYKLKCNADLLLKKTCGIFKFFENGEYDLNADYDFSKQLGSKYKKKQKLGEGTFGEVYLVKPNIELDNKYPYCALKIQKYFPESFSDFFREVETLRSLQGHSNIVKILSVGIGPYNPCYRWIVMEYIPQTAERIMAKLPTLDRISVVEQITFQLLLALEYMHGKSICHRDISPNNILVKIKQSNTNSNLLIYKAKLCDFGLAKNINLADQLTCKVCISTYRPPELVFLREKMQHLSTIGHLDFSYLTTTGKISLPNSIKTTEILLKYGTEIDIWCLAMSLISILNGSVYSFDPLKILEELGFCNFEKGAQSILSTLSRVFLERNVIFKSEIRNSFLNLFNIMLEPNPKKRPSATNLLCHELFSKIVDPTLYQSRRISNLELLKHENYNNNNSNNNNNDNNSSSSDSSKSCLQTILDLNIDKRFKSDKPNPLLYLNHSRLLEYNLLICKKLEVKQKICWISLHLTDFYWCQCLDETEKLGLTKNLKLVIVIAAFCLANNCKNYELIDPTNVLKALFKIQTAYMERGVYACIANLMLKLDFNLSFPFVKNANEIFTENGDSECCFSELYKKFLSHNKIKYPFL